MGSVALGPASPSFKPPPNSPRHDLQPRHHRRNPGQRPLDSRQALFESDGRTFVYTRGPSSFVPHDVSLVRRSESHAVVTGIKEGEIVAMSDPDQLLKSGATQPGSAMKALSQ
jgi:hypothetical protein